MKKKTLFAGFLALVISVSMMSFTAFASESTEPAVDPVAKTVTVSNEDQFVAISNYSNSSSDSKEYPRTFSGWTVVIDSDLHMENKTWKPLVNFYGNMQGSLKEDGTTTTIYNLIVSATKNVGLCANSANGKFSNLTIADSSFTVTNKTTGAYAGAFAGNGFTSSFENCDVVNTTVGGVRFVGGVVGSAYGRITDCDVTGSDIKATTNIISQNGYGDNIGGIVGLYCEGVHTIFNCSVTDTDVTGSRQVGGIAGAVLYGSIVQECTVSSCNIKSTGSLTYDTEGKPLTPCAGGLVGQFAAASSTQIIKIIDNTVEDTTVTQKYTKEVYTGWAVGDANTRLTSSQYSISGNEYTGTTTLNEVGYIAANPSDAN